MHSRISESELVDQDRARQLSATRVKLRRWRWITLGLVMILSVCFTIPIVVLVKSNSNLHKTIDQLNDDKQKQKNDENARYLSKDLQLGELGLTNFSLQSNLALQQSPIIKKLNLSFNHIQDFMGNILGDVTELDLSSNGLEEFSSNSFPKLTSINFDNNKGFKSFTNNTLPAITTLNFPSPRLSQFLLNVFPQVNTLQISADEILFNEFPSASYITITGNKFSANKLGAVVSLKSNNLKEFSLNDCMAQKTQNISFVMANMQKFQGNTLAYVEYLDLSFNNISSFSTNIISRKDLNSIVNLKSSNVKAISSNKIDSSQLLLENNTLESFVDNTLPNINSFQINFNVKQIRNNNFSSATQLNYYNYFQTQSFSGNYVPLIKNLSLSTAQFFGNIFSQLRTLQIISKETISNILNNTGMELLQSLDARQNNITEISPILSALRLLQKLNLRFNNIQIVNNQSHDQILQLRLQANIIEQFSNNSFINLRLLRLTDNPLAKFDFGQMNSLEEIYLNYCSLTDFQTLLPNMTLNVLDLSANLIQNFSTRTDLNTLKSLIMENMPKLVLFNDLDLGNLQFLSLSGPNITTFRQINMSKVSNLILSLPGLQTFAYVLVSIPILHLENCIIDTFESNTISGVKILNLTNNNLQKIGKQTGEDTLQQLLLANNQIDDAGAISLIESLPNSKNSLKLIDLSNNEKISDQTNVQEKLQEYFINVNITFA